MAMTDGGHLVTRALKAEGVQYLFALSGDHIVSIFNATLDEGIKIIDTRHEQAAVHMADAWARVTRQPGVAVVTAGVGVANAVPGMAVAHQSACPVVLISAQIPLSELDTGHGQQIDQLGMMVPVTKWTGRCLSPSRIPEYVSMAFRHACSGRPGPVFLEIPSDALEAQVEDAELTSPTPYPTASPPQGEQRQVEAAMALLQGAERPLVVAGSGVWWSGAGEELREFIEVAQLPLTLSQMARGSVAEDHPLCFGPTRVGSREADVILVLGARLNVWLARGRPPLFGTGQKWIQVDIEPTEIGRNRPIDIGIVGDIREVLRQMTAIARQRPPRPDRADWLPRCRQQAQERRQRLEPQLTSGAVPMHPLRLCKEIDDFLPREATIVLDGGDIAIFAQQALRSYYPGHWLDNGNFGFLGPGTPFAIAAKLARPQHPVLLLSGDGSFGFNGMEFDTAIRHKVPIVAVIGNDAAWGMIKHRQEAIYRPERVVGTELGFVRYDRMVQGLGGYGECVENPQEIGPALKRAFASGLPACINVRTDPTAVSPFTRRTAEQRSGRR